MSSASVRITAEDTSASRDDRFHRFRLISWWDQNRLSRAKILVVGAGALGNELIKNLALVGVGNLFVADLDRIENSNLSRSVLYRESDNGQFKASIACRSAREIYPSMRAQAFIGNIVHDLGLGVFRWADVVLGGLDNREARLTINRACQKLGRPWVDGGIEQIQGVARVFLPDGPCYECTMSQVDWEALKHRRSCNLLSRAEMERGMRPTTPTISSIIAGVQCQEAVKLLHGLQTIGGAGWYFDGVNTDGFVTVFQRKPDCYSHDPLESVVELPYGVADISAGDMLREAQRLLGPCAELELARDVLEKLVCPTCGKEEQVFRSLGKVDPEAAFCRTCPGKRREVVTFFKIRGDEPFVERSLADIGVPHFDILIARNQDRALGLELTGDARTSLGELEGGEEDLQCN
jgi:molybdopterin/thiamine biosynthesis adenylyltransferase